MSWFRNTVFSEKGPLKDPTDVCPMWRMILIWGPISMLLFFCIVIVAIGLVVLAGILLWQLAYGIIDWNGAAGAALRKFLLDAVIYGGFGLLFILAIIAGGFAVEVVVWVVKAIKGSAFATWYRERFPKKERPERPLKVKAPKPPKPPSGLKVFAIWVEGRLHGWCSSIVLVD